MNDVDRWFERTARRRRRPVSLYACLITGRLAVYFGYRLRYPFLIAIVRFAVHVAEFFVLLSSLGGVAAFTVMMLRAGSLLVTGGWWGLLEIMRQRLRAFARLGQRDASENEIGRWLVLGVTVAVVVAVGGGAAIAALRPSGDDPVANLYAFLIVLELAIGFPVRVLHSGLYATRRVYKPVWSMFVPTVIQLGILGLGFFLYPAAAIVASIVVSNALGIWITVHYCLEVYRLTGIRPKLPGAQRFPSLTPKAAIETTFSGLSLRLDAVLVLALVGFYGTGTRTFDLTAAATSWQNIDAFQFFYLILPLFRDTYESAAIFYFDLAKLHSAPALRELQLHFFRALLAVAPFIAGFFWVLAAALGVLVLHDVPVSFLLALLPLFVVRSFIGIYQIRLFAEGRFATHIGTLALLVGLLALVWVNPNPAGDLVQITAAMVVQLIVLIDLQHLRDRRAAPLPVGTSLRDWLDSVRRQRGPATVGAVTIPASITTRQRSAVLGLLEEKLSGTGHFAFESPNRLVFYRAGDPDGTAVYADLQAATGCAVAARADAATVDRPNDPDIPVTPEALIERFRSQFGAGQFFDTATRRGAAGMRSFDASLLAQALPAAVAAARDGADLVAVGNHRLTPVCFGGTLRLLFVLPVDADRASVRRWLRTVGEWKRSPATEFAA